MTCSSLKFPTREEADAYEVESNARMVAYFEALSRGECPTHKRKVELEQRGRCVYGDCGCRLYQGTLPRKRKEQAR